MDWKRISAQYDLPESTGQAQKLDSDNYYMRIILGRQKVVFPKGFFTIQGCGIRRRRVREFRL